MNIQDKFRIDLATGLRIDTVSPFEFGEDIIETRCLESFYLPKWNFETLTWEESATQEYIDSLKPTVVEEVPLDVRVAKVEQEQEQIVDVLAEMLGV